MNNKLSKILCAATIAVGVAACENSADKARKPALINTITNLSLNDCDLQKQYPQTEGYEERLREVLKQTYSTDLDKIIQNGIAVCLDQRLSHLDKGFFDRKPYITFYPGRKSVLSLYDTGKGKSSRGFFEDNKARYSDNLIRKFFKTYSSDDLRNLKPEDVQFGYTYTRYNSGTKSTTRYYRWKDAQGYAAFEKNPYLNFAPLRK